MKLSSFCIGVMWFSLTLIHSGRLNDSLFSFKEDTCRHVREWREYFTHKATLIDMASDTDGLSNSLRHEHISDICSSVLKVFL